MFKRIFSSLPGGRKSDASDSLPSPDLSRIFPHMRVEPAADETDEAPAVETEVMAAEEIDDRADQDDAFDMPEFDDDDMFDEAPARAETPEVPEGFDAAQWLQRDVGALNDAFEMFTFAPNRSSYVQELYRAAHNLRGTAEPCGAPVIARLAASLCDLVDGRSGLDGDVALVNLHVQAIRAAEMAGNAADPLADAVCVALEDQVRTKTAI